MCNLALVAALEREVRPLVRNWRVRPRAHDGRQFRFFEKQNVVLVCGGIGMEAARRAAEAAIALYQPRTVYSVGFAGALDGSLKVGDVVRPARVVNAGDASSVSIDAGKGILVTFGSIATPGQKRKLRESFDALAVDMEASAVACAAGIRGLRFVALKAISDEVGFALPDTGRFVGRDGSFSQGRFVRFAAARPWIWLQVLRLARNSRRASHALCDSLRQVTEQTGSASSAAPGPAGI